MSFVLPAGRIHLQCCPHCPSAPGCPSDPESDQIESWVRSGEMPAMDAVFACAWRPTKLCKGWCDLLGVKQEEGRT